MADLRGTRARAIIVGAVCVLAIVGAAAYVAGHREQHAKGTAAPLSTSSLSAVSSGPHIVFRNTALGSHYGMVAMVPLADPAGPRALTSTSCDRVYATAQQLLCVASKLGVDTQYSAHILDAETMQPRQALSLSGIPSRARLSRDGTLAATTSFVAGDSYAATSFSTRTTITRVGGAPVGNLDQFTLIHDGQVIAPVDRNYWGVTFASDDNTFYATVEWAQHTWLVRGDLATHTVTTLHEDAECPSLSPDGRTIVFKQRGSLPTGQWRLVAYDLATRKVTPLAERRSVDDQVEWLNDNTVIYGLPRAGSQAATDDVWAVPANGTGQPKLLIPQAWSPAVVN